MPNQNDPYASIAKPVAQVQTGTVGGHAPEGSPAYAEGVSNPPTDDPYAGIATDSPAQPEERYDTQLFKAIPGAAKSVGKGLLEGLGTDAANLTGSKWLQGLTTPSGDEGDVAGQKFGKGIEQGAEFLLPGLGEEKAASLVPDIKYARPAARIAYNALTSGAINKAQGGTFTGGAEAGIGGGLLGEGMRAAAPTLAEKAIGIRGKFDRSFNKAPGRALLDETRGISPENVAQQAKTRIGDLSDQTRSLARQSSAPVSLLPARDSLNDAAQRALSQNASGTYGQINNMENTLLHRFDTKQLIPPSISPEDALNLRQGFDQEHLGWNPDIHEPASAAGRKAYGALTGEIHNAVPGTEALDTRVSNLIPVSRRAQTTALNDNTGAKILGRFGAHTGALAPALAGAGIGGYGGYQHGGAEGALIGGTLGAVVPEMIASPSAQLFAARALNRPQLLTHSLTGGLLNVGRNEDEPQ